ncbi:general transcription factor 3C polypeptide 5-like [Lytechinus pictus]|uniref:general transcription factor 3C polypeptide 5-like n=1 Tax=Lytechinus pictus TaxID=7653 RepID=UPI0030B9C09C
MGYDPREHPESKNYQLLDFRIRKELTDKSVKLMLKKKRMILYPHQTLKNKRVIPAPLLSGSAEPEGSNRESFDSYYIMRRGILPAYHQMFYQLCDLEDPELQTIINNPQWHKTKPNMKSGFFEAEMFRRLRDCLTQMIKDTVLEVNASKSLQDDSSQGSTPSTSASTPEMPERGEKDDEEGPAAGEDEEDDGEDEDGLDDGGIGDDDAEEMEDKNILCDEADGAEDATGIEKDDKEVAEEVDSENEMAMEMLEFLDPSMLPS